MVGNTEVIAALIQEGCALDRQDKVSRAGVRQLENPLWGSPAARDVVIPVLPLMSQHEEISPESR